MEVQSQMRNARSPFQVLLLYEQLHQQLPQEVAFKEDVKSNNYLAFSAGEENYLLLMEEVLEVMTGLENITPLPFSPPWLIGLTSHRNEIYSVVDFKKFIDRKARSIKNKGSYILLQNTGKGYILKVETVWGIRACDVQSVSSSLSWLDGQAQADEKNWLRINLERLVTDASFIQSI